MYITEIELLRIKDCHLYSVVKKISDETVLGIQLSQMNSNLFELITYQYLLIKICIYKSVIKIFIYKSVIRIIKYECSGCLKRSVVTMVNIIINSSKSSLNIFFKNETKQNV